MDATLGFQLVILAATGFLSVYAASCARRAASFDVTADFAALANAVAKLQQLARSDQMKRVRAGSQGEPAAPAAPAAHGPLTHDQLRALVRSRNGAKQ